MTPISLGVDIAHIYTILFPETDLCYRSGDFAGNECSSSSGGFMIEQNTTARQLCTLPYPKGGRTCKQTSRMPH
jgi:hypothetical protein